MYPFLVGNLLAELIFTAGTLSSYCPHKKAGEFGCA
jgi:hypothetical protein